MEKILSGLRVLDFTDALTGPYCTRYLTDCGCEVINLEKPGGKVAWSLPYVHNGYSADYMYNHCGKKSFAIDLKAEGARELVLKMAKSADIVVENFRPGVMASFGLDYKAFKEANPTIIMCSISAYGQNSPFAELMGVDIITQAHTGVVHMSSELGERPHFVAFPVSDILAGVTAFGAICAALYRRGQTGQGDYIDIAMFDCLLGALHNAVGAHILSKGKDEYRYMGSFSPDFSPCGVYKGRDGYLALFLRTDLGWERLAELMEKPELATDPRLNTTENRVKHNDEVTAIIEAWLQKFDKVSDVVALLQSWRMLAGPVLSMGQVIDTDPQCEARELLKEIEHPVLGPMRFVNTPIHFQNSAAGVEEPPPVVAGQHTEEVLRQVLNLDDAEITKLKTAGIVFGSS